MKLDHAPGASGQTALFIPKGFDASKPAVIIPYFHGHRGGKHGSLNGIEHAFEVQNLAELAAKSGKNVVFVIPQLGNQSDTRPEFAKPGEAAKFLDESAVALSKVYAETSGADQAASEEAFKKMSVIPLSYSGGYRAAEHVVGDKRVAGAVLLDTLYGNVKPYTDLSARAPVLVLASPSTGNGTNAFKQGAKTDNVAVLPIKNDQHADLVQTALPDTLAAISFNADGKVMLGNVTSVSAPPAPAVKSAFTAPPKEDKKIAAAVPAVAAEEKAAPSAAAPASTSTDTQNAATAPNKAKAAPDPNTEENDGKGAMAQIGMLFKMIFAMFSGLFSGDFSKMPNIFGGDDKGGKKENGSLPVASNPALEQELAAAQERRAETAKQLAEIKAQLDGAQNPTTSASENTNPAMIRSNMIARTGAPSQASAGASALPAAYVVSPGSGYVREKVSPS